jgi:cysteine-rich repeat protein
MSKITDACWCASFVVLLAHCAAEKKERAPVATEASPQEGGLEMLIPSKNRAMIAGLDAEKLESKAKEAGDVPSSFFKEASPPCHEAFHMVSFADLSPAHVKTSSALSCWPSGRCEGFVENIGEPIKLRKIKFGEDTTTLELAFLDRYQELAQKGLKTLSPTLNESERTFVWRDFMADTKEEKDLRDVYKVMSLWSSVTLKWLPCKNESGSACSVQPQVQFAMLAVTPQANSTGDGASCTLFFGVPDETKAQGFSKPSNIMRQLKGSVRPALDAEFQVMGACGDNNIQKKFEECDDGNVTTGDGCSAECKVEGQ